MLLVNMDNVPRRELNKLQISEILHGFMRIEKSSNPDKYARCMPEYSRFVSRYAFAVNGGKIKISDKNIVATVNFLEKMSGSVPCEVECVDSAVSKLKIQYADAIINGRIDVPKKDLKDVIDGFESELIRNNDKRDVITSALEKIRPLYQEMCQEDKDEFVQDPSKVFFEKQKERSEKKERLKKLGFKNFIIEKFTETGVVVKFGSEIKVFYESDINKFISEIKRLDNSNLEHCEQVAFNLFALKDNENLSEKQKARIANALNAFYKKYEQLKEKPENKSNVHVLEKIKVKVADVAQSCEQKIAEKIEQYKNVAQQKAQEREEKVAAKREIRKAKTDVLKPLFARAMPYAASLLLLVGTTVLFANDSARANEKDASKKEVKATDAPSVKKDNNTVRATVQDLAKTKPVVKDTVVKSESEVAKKTIETDVVKNNANVKSSDKFYDSRLDKFFGDKKSDVLQKIQNRMQNVDLGGISAERVAYTVGVYSAYGYNIDVLNNFVNGAELNSDQIKELKSVIDLAKPHGTGVRDLAAAHMTSREIHEMCAGGDKSSAEKKIAQAKSNVKSSNAGITKSDVLKMVNDNIKCGKSGLNPDDSAALTKLLLQDNLGPDDCANMTKLLLLAGVDKNIVNQIVRQNDYSNTVLMPDNYVQRLEKQSGQKKPVWYSRCFRISRYSR